METISGGPSEQFLPDTILQAAKLNKALENWVVTEVPGEDVGEIGDVVFVTGPGDGGSSTSTNAPGLVHLHTESFSAVSSVSIDEVFSSTYDNYRVMVWMFASVSQSPLIRFRSSGSDNTSAAYDYQRMQAASEQVSASRSSSQTSMQTGSIHTVEDSALFMDIFGPNLPYRTVAKGGSGDNRSYINDFSGTFTSNVQFDGFSLAASSGTFTGTIRIYGYSKGGN